MISLATIIGLVRKVKQNWRVCLEVALAVAGMSLVAHMASNALEREVSSRTAKKVAVATQALQTEIVQSHQRETGLIKKIDKSDSLITSLKKELEHAPVVVFTRPSTISRPSAPAGDHGAGAKAETVGCSADVPGGDPVLSAVAVRVLDSARLNRDLGSTDGGDAEVGAPTDVTVSEFIENDLEVVRRYQRLAARHDELVDYVENKLKLPVSADLKSK